MLAQAQRSASPFGWSEREADARTYAVSGALPGRLGDCSPGPAYECACTQPPVLAASCFMRDKAQGTLSHIACHRTCVCALLAHSETLPYSIYDDKAY